MVGEHRIPGHITGLYIFAVINLFVLLNVSLVSADVVAMNASTNNTIEYFDDLPAKFGSELPIDGFVGRLIYVTPHNACEIVAPPPPESDYPWIALIVREKCSFSQKVYHVQKFYAAAIVHNSDGNNSLMPMGGDDKFAYKVTIPSVFVGYDSGMKLAHRYNASHGDILIRLVEVGPDYNWQEYLIPMGIVVGCCVIFAIIFFVAKSVSSYVGRRRARLSTRALRRIPTKKFKKGDHYDTCAICLEDYEEGEKLRVLPCDHTFHTKCVDPWLTKRKKTCPCCKRRVIPRTADTDSESDENDVEAPTENTPLIRNQGTTSSNTTTTTSTTRPARVPVNARRTGRSRRSRNRREQPVNTDAPISPIPEEGEEQGAVGGVGISDQVIEVIEEGPIDIEVPSTSTDARGDSTSNTTSSGKAPTTASSSKTPTTASSGKNSSKKHSKTSGKKRKTTGNASGNSSGNASGNASDNASGNASADVGVTSTGNSHSKLTSNTSSDVSGNAAECGNAAAAAEEPSIVIDVGDSDSGRSSPARVEGSINVGFSESDDETMVASGRSKGKKRKKKSNQVV